MKRTFLLSAVCILLFQCSHNKREVSNGVLDKNHDNTVDTLSINDIKPVAKKENCFKKLINLSKRQNEGLLLAINDVTYLIDTNGVIDSIDAIMLPTKDGFYYFKYYQYDFMKRRNNSANEEFLWRHRKGKAIAYNKSYSHLLDTIEYRTIIESKAEQQAKISATTNVPQKLYTKQFCALELFTPLFISYTKTVSWHGGGAHAYGTDHMQTVALEDFFNYGMDSLPKGTPEKTAQMFKPYVADAISVNRSLAQYWNDHWNQNFDTLALDSNDPSLEQVLTKDRSVKVDHFFGCYNLSVIDYLFIGYANAPDGYRTMSAGINSFGCDPTIVLDRSVMDYYISPYKNLVVQYSNNHIQVFNTHLNELVFETNKIDPEDIESFTRNILGGARTSVTMTEWCSDKNLSYWKKEMQLAKASVLK